ARHPRASRHPAARGAWAAGRAVCARRRHSDRFVAAGAHHVYDALRGHVLQLPAGRPAARLSAHRNAGLLGFRLLLVHDRRGLPDGRCLHDSRLHPPRRHPPRDRLLCIQRRYTRVRNQHHRRPPCRLTDGNRENAMEIAQPTREHLIHRLYEAAELEHNLMCTYLYAAFSLKDAGEGLTTDEAAATARWRRTILQVAVEEMGHLCAVWNITSALGGAPRFGRGNFPIDPGYLPAGVVVKLAPFNEAVLQHFIYLERPKGSTEADGEGFEPPVRYRRGAPAPRLTPMGIDYDTVGDFYASLGEEVRSFVARVGEKDAFCGDPALQLAPEEIDLGGAKPVICSKTALAAFDAIVRQGEGAPVDSEDSHYQKFLAVRTEYAALRKANSDFRPAFPAAVNPVLRRPPRPEGRVWIENEDAAQCVDLANAAYGLMIRMVGYSYSVPRPAPAKAVVIDLGIGLMKAVTLLAARLPAGPSNPECHAGLTFVTLRDAAAFPQGVAAHRFFTERLAELARGAATMDSKDKRIVAAARLLADLSQRAGRDLATASSVKPVAAATASPS